MKNLILTFILIILTICLVKQMNMKVFNQTDNFEGIQGCNIQKLVKPSAEEYYNCLMEQTSSIFKEMNKIKKLDGAGQSKYMNRITKQIRNYFISLYINNLEKHYTGIIIIRPTDYMIVRESDTYIHRAKPMHYFMKPTHENGSIYHLHPIGTKIETVSGLRIPNIGGILVPTGYSLGISNPDKNKSGDKCRLEQHRPGGAYGNCIPKDLKKYHEYLKGGIFYNKYGLAHYYTKTTEAKKYMPYPRNIVERYHARWIFGSGWQRIKWPALLPSRPQTVVRRRNGWGAMRDRRGDPIRRGNKISSGAFNYHTDTHSLESCYLRGKASCHYAYGIPKFKHLNIIPQVDFFNEFYAILTKRNEHRIRFQNGDFSKLDPYF